MRVLILIVAVDGSTSQWMNQDLELGIVLIHYCPV